VAHVVAVPADTPGTQPGGRKIKAHTIYGRSKTESAWRPSVVRLGVQDTACQPDYSRTLYLPPYIFRVNPRTGSLYKAGLWVPLGHSSSSNMYTYPHILTYSRNMDLAPQGIRTWVNMCNLAPGSSIAYALSLTLISVSHPRWLPPWQYHDKGSWRKFVLRRRISPSSQPRATTISSLVP
jgi:hypothetical protein